MTETDSIPTDVLLPGVPRLLLICLAFLALAILIGKVVQKLGRVVWIALRLYRAWRHSYVYDNEAIQNVSSRRTVARHYLLKAARHLWASDRYAGYQDRCMHPSGCDELTWDLTRNKSPDATQRQRVCLKHRCAKEPNCGQMAAGTIEPHTHYQRSRLVCWDHIDHDDPIEIGYFEPFPAFKEDWKRLYPEPITL